MNLRAKDVFSVGGVRAYSRQALGPAHGGTCLQSRYLGGGAQIQGQFDYIVSLRSAQATEYSAQKGGGENFKNIQ